MRTSGIVGRAGLVARFRAHQSRPPVLGCAGLATVIWLFTTPYVCAQSVLYVDEHAGGPIHDGSSWCNAYTALQDGLAHADASGENVTEIRVAGGIYKPDQGENQIPGDREATFQLLDGVAFLGGYAGCLADNPDEHDVESYETILSGDLAGDDVGDPGDASRRENSYHVVTGSGTDEKAILDGFTITGGNADGLSPHNMGGGMYNYAGSPTVTNCTFSGNSARGRGGGGMHNREGSAPTLVDCIIAGNRGFSGGGMYNSRSDPTLVNCTFHRNTTGLGGGMLNHHASPTLIGCHFSENEAVRHGPCVGGAISNNAHSHPTLIGCVFHANTAQNWGGALYVEFGSTPMLVDCVFRANSAIQGGALLNFGSAPVLTNCTFAHNSASSEGGAVHNRAGSAPTLTNCILWGNTDRSGASESAQVFNEDDSGVNTPIINYTAIQGWTGLLGGIGNIGDDALFVDPVGPDGIPGTEDDDLRLSPGSPCIDAGDNEAVPVDVATDFDGNPRFVDDPETPDTGSGTPPIVDMGAYEYQALGPMTLQLDIKPGQCPNRINPRKRGVARIAIVGTEFLDVRQIDRKSLVLTRADGVGGSISPVESRRWRGVPIRDVATPFDGELCDCHRRRGDGIDDLVLDFPTRGMADALELHSAQSGDLITLTVSGMLVNGTPFEASDCIRIIGRP